MPKRKRSPVSALLQNLQSVHPTARRTELGGPSLDALVGKIIDEIASESERERRRFTVLRRSDVLHEPHDAIARDVGLRAASSIGICMQPANASRALDRAFSVRASQGFLHPAVAARRMTVETLRASGQHDRARAAATESLRGAGAVEAIELLCLRAELETESGRFEFARESTREARALLPQVGDARLLDLFSLACDVEDFESAHCLGTPAAPAAREACLRRLRSRAGGDRPYASLLVKALIGEASLLFGRGDETHALGLIEEAAELVRHEPLVDTRLAIDVQVRVSGLHAVRPDGLSGALEEAARIVDAGMHWRDARTLRLGLQTMSAHY